MSDRPLNRRRFASQIALGVTSTLGSALLTRVSAEESQGQSLPAGRYVDVHTHLGTVWNTGTELTAEALLRWMDTADIAQAVVLPLVSPESSSYPISTEFVLSQTKPYRDCLIPFCSVDPRTSYSGGKDGLVKMLKQYVEAGARGFGEHKPGVKIDDPRNMALYGACAELQLPVLFHLDNERNMDAPGLPGLENVLREYPTLTMIGHGPGWWASIGGGTTAADLAGYPRGDVAPGGAIDRLMDKYPNLYGDLSAGSGAGAIKRDLKFGREFLVRRQDRLMFGTDFLAPGQ
ncbi:MAG TPA: amidohydrolase family protein, partial [Pirellulales bacterium]|nr:amidohydrolase family protein [Pirellulales bacterium]